MPTPLYNKLTTKRYIDTRNKAISDFNSGLLSKEEVDRITGSIPDSVDYNLLEKDITRKSQSDYGYFKPIDHDLKFNRIESRPINSISSQSQLQPIPVIEPTFNKPNAVNTRFNTYGNLNAPIGEINAGGERITYNNETQLNNLKDSYNIPKYGWGSVVGSLAGAGIGTLIAPGIGTTIGAQLGSGIGGLAENRVKENQMIDAGQDLPLDNKNNEILMNTVGGVGNSVMRTMAYGGMTFNPNSEVENNEVGLAPNGSTETFKGDKHGQDFDNDGFEGIPKELPEGTKIFSDRLKIGKQSFAKVANKFSNDKWQNILSDPRANSMDKETAKIMMTQNTQKLNSLFKEQESMKFKKGMPSEFAYGGMYKKKKFAYGGINKDEILPIPGLESSLVPNAQFDQSGNYTGMPNFENVNLKFKNAAIPNYTGNQTPRRDLTNPVNYMDTNQFTPNINEQDFNPTEIIPNINSQNYNPDQVIPNTNTNSNINFNEPNKPTDWRNIAAQSAMYAPTIYNTARGILGKPDQLNKDSFTSKERLDFNRINVDPALRAIDEQAQTGRTAAKGTGFSRGSYMSNLNQINTQAEAEKAKTLVNAENLNRQVKQGVDTYNINLGLSDEQQRRQNYMYNQQSKGKKSEFLGKGLEGISAISQTNKLMDNQQDADRIRLGSINSILQNYEIPADLQERIFNKTATPEDYSNLYKFKKSK